RLQLRALWPEQRLLVALVRSAHAAHVELEQAPGAATFAKLVAVLDTVYVPATLSFGPGCYGSDEVGVVRQVAWGVVGDELCQPVRDSGSGSPRRPSATRRWRAGGSLRWWRRCGQPAGELLQIGARGRGGAQGIAHRIPRTAEVESLSELLHVAA